MEVEEATKVFGVRQEWSGSFFEVNNASGGLGIIWNSRLLKGDPMLKARFWQAFRFSSLTINFSGILINVYGPTKLEEKKVIWGRFFLYVPLWAIYVG